jgi:hypothetical protein
MFGHHWEGWAFLKKTICFLLFLLSFPSFLESQCCTTVWQIYITWQVFNFISHMSSHKGLLNFKKSFSWWVPKENVFFFFHFVFFAFYLLWVKISFDGLKFKSKWLCSSSTLKPRFWHDPFLLRGCWWRYMIIVGWWVKPDYIFGGNFRSGFEDLVVAKQEPRQYSEGGGREGGICYPKP